MAVGRDAGVEAPGGAERSSSGVGWRGVAEGWGGSGGGRCLREVELPDGAERPSPTFEGGENSGAFGLFSGGFRSLRPD